MVGVVDIAIGVNVALIAKDVVVSVAVDVVDVNDVVVDVLVDVVVHVVVHVVVDIVMNAVFF